MPTLEITTMIGCPVMCTFCPQPGLKTAYTKGELGDKYLSLNNFKYILDKLPKHLRIDFSGMAEPWSNPECTEMLRYTLESGFKVAIFTTLYGMTESDTDVVLGLVREHRAQVDVICLHLPDFNGNMRGWKTSKEWENVFAKFRQFGAEKIISRFNMMTMDGSGRVHETLTHLNIKLGRWTGLTRAGSLDLNEVKGQRFCEETPRYNMPVMCSVFPFYDHNVLLPNGDVALCCMDYNLKHILGNLLKQNYYDLFTGEVMSRLRKENMTPGFSKCSICKSCTWSTPYKIGFNALWTSCSTPEQRQGIVRRVMNKIVAFAQRRVA